MLIRYASHAHTLWLNGYRSLLPIKYASKAPIIEEWQLRGHQPLTEAQLLKEAPRYPSQGIGNACDGETLFLDLDIAVYPAMTESEAARVVQASADCENLFAKHLGETIVRHTVSCKRLMMYRVAPGSCETRAGTAVECFSAVGSKQVVLYGLHPDGPENRWPLGGPLETLKSDLPLVKAEHVYELRNKAIDICIKAGVRTKSDAARGARSGAGLGAPGAMSDIMRELLRRTARASAADVFGDDEFAASTDPVAVCQRAVAQAGPGERGNTAAAAACVLAIKGYSDEQIVEALDALFQKTLTDTGDAKRDFKQIVKGVRRRMGKLYWEAPQPLETLDAELNFHRWSVYR